MQVRAGVRLEAPAGNERSSGHTTARPQRAQRIAEGQRRFERLAERPGAALSLSVYQASGVAPL